MATLFENYEQQYSVITAEITADICRLTSSVTIAADRYDLITEIEKHVEETQDLLEQMDLEAREVEQSKQQWCKNKLECYKAELKRLIGEFNKAKNVKQSNGLGSGYESDEEYSVVRLSSEQKQRLLDNSEKIERTGKRIEDGYRIVLETQEIGAHIMNDLHSQRETIQRSRARLRDTGEDLNRSSRIMNSMIMRNIQQRAVLFIVAACFLTAIVLAIYWSIY